MIKQMKRTLIAAVMTGLMFVATTTPAMALVGVAQPEDPDMMVITKIALPEDEASIPEERVTPSPDEVILLEKDVPEGDLMWYTNPVEMVPMNRHAVKGYVVKKGDSLWKIVSKSLKTTNSSEIARGVATVAEINNLSNPDVLFVGQDLTIPHELNS